MYKVTENTTTGPASLNDWNARMMRTNDAAFQKEQDMTSKWTAMLAASVYPHLNNDLEADLVSGSDVQSIVKRVSAPRPTGHIDVTLLEQDPITGDIAERVVTTDSDGGLPIGAGRWLNLGGCHRSTARRRAVRYFAGLGTGTHG